MVVDGKHRRQYDGIGTISFSPDSTRVGYGARLGNKWLVVVDETEGKQYDAIGAGSPVLAQIVSA